MAYRGGYRGGAQSSGFDQGPAEAANVSARGGFNRGGGNDAFGQSYGGGYGRRDDNASSGGYRGRGGVSQDQDAGGSYRGRGGVSQDQDAGGSYRANYQRGGNVSGGGYSGGGYQRDVQPRNDLGTSQGFSGGGRGAYSQQNYRGADRGASQNFEGANKPQSLPLTDDEKARLSEWEAKPIVKPSPFAVFRGSSVTSENQKTSVKEDAVMEKPVETAPEKLTSVCVPERMIEISEGGPHSAHKAGENVGSVAKEITQKPVVQEQSKGRPHEEVLDKVSGQMKDHVHGRAFSPENYVKIAGITAKFADAMAALNNFFQELAR